MKTETTIKEVLTVALAGLVSYMNAETTSIASRNALGQVERDLELAIAMCPLPIISDEHQAEIDANYTL